MKKWFETTKNFKKFLHDSTFSVESCFVEYVYCRGAKRTPIFILFTSKERKLDKLTFVR